MNEMNLCFAMWIVNVSHSQILLWILLLFKETYRLKRPYCISNIPVQKGVFELISSRSEKCFLLFLVPPSSERKNFWLRYKNKLFIFTHTYFFYVCHYELYLCDNISHFMQQYLEIYMFLIYVLRKYGLK